MWKDTNDAPKSIRDEVNHNSRDMHLFYSKSQKARDDILERIYQHRTKEKLEEYAKDFDGHSK